MLGGPGQDRVVSVMVMGYLERKLSSCPGLSLALVIQEIQADRSWAFLQGDDIDLEFDDESRHQLGLKLAVWTLPVRIRKRIALGFRTQQRTIRAP